MPVEAGQEAGIPVPLVYLLADQTIDGAYMCERIRSYCAHVDCTMTPRSVIKAEVEICILTTVCCYRGSVEFGLLGLVWFVMFLWLSSIAEAGDSART